MTQAVCGLCFVLLLYLRSCNAAFIPLRPLIPATSTYKPSTLLLPPGFESPKAPPEPMLYPYAVPSTGKSTAPQLKVVSSATPDWIPVALNADTDLHLKRTLAATSSTPAAIILEDRISNDELRYSSPAYKDGPVFESIVYGTWKPDPPLQPFKTANTTTQAPSLRSKGSASSTAMGSGKAFNKTINRQHGGFIGSIQQKPLKIERQTSLMTTSNDNRSKETKLQVKVKKQGRRKIRPLMSTTEANFIQNDRDVATAITATTKEYSEPHQNVIKVNTTDPKLVEVAKQINESLEIKYNHKQTSTHSIDMMMTTTAEANNHAEDQEADDYKVSGGWATSNAQWTTKAFEFSSTAAQADYDDDYSVEEIQNINATRRSWPADFDEEPLTTTHVSYPSLNNLDKVSFNDSSLAAEASEIPLALSALNIPPSLWPKLPGNITKLGKPYEAESSAEEPALCVPITVREQNIMNPQELIYIERIFCFPMPLATTSEKSDRIWKQDFTSSSTTLKTVTTTKIQNFEDFAASNPRATSKANSLRHNIFLAASFLSIYLKFIL